MNPQIARHFVETTQRRCRMKIEGRRSMCHVGSRLAVATICLCTGALHGGGRVGLWGYRGAGHTMTGALSVEQPAADRT